MKRRLFFGLLILLTPISLWGQRLESGKVEGYDLIRNYDLLDVQPTPPVLPTSGDQYLVGPNPSGAWAGKANDIARWNGSAWVFIVPSPSDQAFDNAGRQYLYTGIATLFDGLWLDSEWRELTPFMAKWKTGSVLTNSATVVAADHGHWLAVYPGGSDVTLTLPTSFLPPISGMRFMLELDCSTRQTITVTVAGGGILQHPDGTQTVTPFAFDASACSNDSFVYEVIAGNTTTGAQWYLVPQQGSMAP